VEFFNGLLGLAAVHLRQCDKDDNLDAAEKWLQKADALLAGQKNPDYLRLYGVFRALRGEISIATVYLQQSLDLDPACEGTKAALEALK